MGGRERSLESAQLSCAVQVGLTQLHEGCEHLRLLALNDELIQRCVGLPHPLALGTLEMEVDPGHMASHGG